MASRAFTYSVVESRAERSQACAVLNRDELLARLNAKVEAKEIKNVAIARALGLPDSRIPSLLRGERRLYYDEGVKLAEEFELERELSPPPPSIWRLFARHISTKLGLSFSSDDPQIQELASDLAAVARFAHDPQVQGSIEAAEGFLRGLDARREGPIADPSENAPQSVR